jgi:signal transduction histidine kinase
MSTRARVALAAALVAAGAVLLAGAIGWLLASRTASEPDEPRTATYLEQRGSGVAVISVIETPDDEVGAARAEVFRWTALAALLVVPAAALAGWAGAGRLAGTADADAARARGRADERRRIQEVAHELRTPLAVTATNLDLVTGVGTSPDDARRYLAAARRAIDRMARTVDDLDAHGGLAFDPADTRAIDLAAEASELVAEHAGPAGVRDLRLAVDALAPVVVSADRQAVRTVVGNVLANALRLAPRNSTITLTAGTRDDWAYLAVTDEGPGIDAADHPLVFRRNWRGRYETDRGDNATATRGLGLAIARQVAEAQGGRLTLTSEVGTGSTFTLWLPRTDTADPSAVVADDGFHARVAAVVP